MFSPDTKNRFSTTTSSTTSSTHGGVVTTTSPTTGVVVVSTTSSSTSVNTSSNGTIRNAFKGLVLKATSSNNNNNSTHPAYLPEHTSYEKLIEKHGEQMEQLKLTQNEINLVINDTEQFRLMQEILRTNYRACTDSVLKEIWFHIVRDRLVDKKIKESQAAIREKKKLAIQKEVDRQYTIKKELTEARIKAQQALGILPNSSSTTTDTTTSKDSINIEEELEEDEQKTERNYDDDDDIILKESTNNNYNDSPTNVTEVVTIDNPESFVFKPELLSSSHCLSTTSDDDNDNDDIQEIFD